MTRRAVAPRRATSLVLMLALALASLLGVAGLPAAQAAVSPVLPRDTTTGVTADPLPTEQIDDGWVWDQAIVGDTVFAGGSFSSVRFPGETSGTPVSNLIAYSISTGHLVSKSFPALNGQVRVLALSPDQSRLYVGGDFTFTEHLAQPLPDGTTDVPHDHLLAIDTATGQLVSSFAATINGPVYALATTGDTVYAGGQFTMANGNDAAHARGRLAAFDSSGGLLDWTPKTDGRAVWSLLVAPGGNVIAGGQFAQIGNMASSTMSDAQGSVSLDPSTAALRPWNVTSTVKQYGDSGAVLSLKTDGTTVYGSGYWFGGTESNYEGVWAVDPADGSIKWLADCHGDTYDTTISNGVVYAASHQHDCSNIGGFGEQTPRTEWRANAFSTAATGTVQHNTLTPTKYKDFYGNPSPSLVSWFPEFALGPTSGAYSGQPTLTIESNDSYVVVGGQFPSVNGNKDSRGLVRFARPSLAPNKSGPVRTGPYGAAYDGGPTVAPGAGSSLSVSFRTSWDRDDTNLTYQLFRLDKGSTPIKTWTGVASPWWNRTALSYVDTTTAPGTTYKYQVLVLDPKGNKAYSAIVSGTPQAGTVYSNQVVADGASDYWRLNGATSSSTALDSAGPSNLTLGAGVTQGAAPAAFDDTGASFSGASTASASTTTSVAAPATYSLEAWFQAPAGSTGGQIVGFGSSATGLSSNHDRQIYLNTSGQVAYYVYNNAPRGIASKAAYTDGQWHHVVATLSSGSGMVLYVDGTKVASYSAVTTASSYSGYWRLGGDKLPAGQNSYLAGNIDDVAVYPTALSAAQVADHYTKATGKTPVKVAVTTGTTR